MRAPLLTAALTFAAIGHTQTICIDPGHPSESGRGTHGKHTTEIGVAWEVAKQLQTRLEEDGYTIVMTKAKAGQYVTNRKRAEIANNAHAALFLRLHCDASATTGFAVYYPDHAGKAPDGHRGPTNDALRRTKPVAIAFHKALSEALHGALVDHGLMGDGKTAIGSKQGALTGSIYSNVPTILVEMVVLTNPRDEAFVTSKKGSDQLVEALTKAVEAAIPKR